MYYLKKPCFCTLLIFIFSILVFSQNSSTQPSNQNEFYGKFENELIPDTRQLYRIVLSVMRDSVNSKFKFPIEKKSFITIGYVLDLTSSGNRFKVALVEEEKKLPLICIDINGNSTFNKKECFSMKVSKNNPNDFEYTFNTSIKMPLFSKFPTFLRYRKNFTFPGLKQYERVLMQSLLGYAVGKVDLKTRSVRVQYQISPQAGTISTTSGIMGVDVNGDGQIENKPFSYETSYAADNEIVFRFGDFYLSTARLDIAKNQIVMRKRTAKEYKRIELEVGKVIPNFSFVDFDNKPRMLTDFRGKYVLVDFWGLWCVDCIREFPYQYKAYKQFRSRGFEILGMDTDEDTEKVKKVLKRSGINWTQARHDSIKELVETSYRIQEYPSAILIDPNGKILILDQSLLKGEKLLKTLNKILPK